MTQRPGENSHLMDYAGKVYSQEESVNGRATTVLQLRDWLDDPYEQVAWFVQQPVFIACISRNRISVG